MITSTEPNVSATGRYSIGETCAALGIHRNTLCRYTEQGLIKCGFRRAAAAIQRISSLQDGIRCAAAMLKPY